MLHLQLPLRSAPPGCDRRAHFHDQVAPFTSNARAQNHVHAARVNEYGAPSRPPSPPLNDAMNKQSGSFLEPQKIVTDHAKVRRWRSLSPIDPLTLLRACHLLIMRSSFLRYVKNWNYARGFSAASFHPASTSPNARNSRPPSF